MAAVRRLACSSKMQDGLRPLGYMLRLFSGFDGTVSEGFDSS